MDKVFNEKAAIEKAAAQLKFMIPDQNLRAAIFLTHRLKRFNLFLSSVSGAKIKKKS